MLQDFYVYTHTRNDTGATFYAGKGRKERAHRTSQRSPHWSRIAAKHGRTVHIVAEGLDDELALLCEVEQIDKCKRLGINLVNMTEGGDGAKLTPEAEARRIEAIRQASRRPDVIAQRTANSHAIAANPELLARRNASIKAALQNPEVKAALAAAVRSPAALANHRAAMARPEVRAKMAAAAAVPVLCVETGRIFSAVIEAAVWLRSEGRSHAQGGHISQACKGIRKTAYGYTWRHAPKD